MTKEVKAATKGEAEAIEEGRFCSACRHIVRDRAALRCGRPSRNEKARVDLVVGEVLSEPRVLPLCSTERLPTVPECLRLDWLVNFGRCGLAGRFWEPKTTVVDGAKVDNTAPASGHLKWDGTALSRTYSSWASTGIPEPEAPADSLIVGGGREPCPIQPSQVRRVEGTFRIITRPKPPPSRND